MTYLIIFISYRARECFNGPCEELTQETSWCDNGGVSGRCADPWNLSWPCGEGLEEQKTRIVGGYEGRCLSSKYL